METINKLVGNCTGDEYPDTWFPELDNNRPSQRRLQELAKDVQYAKAKCATCPIKEDCLAEGMQKNNLPFGIWGGKLAGERIESLNGDYDNDGIQVDVRKALVFYSLMRPLIKESHE